MWYALVRLYFECAVFADLEFCLPQPSLSILYNIHYTYYSSITTYTNIYFVEKIWLKFGNFATLLPKIECIAGIIIVYLYTQCQSVRKLPCLHYTIWNAGIFLLILFVYVATACVCMAQWWCKWEETCDWQQMIKSFEYFIIAHTHTHTHTLAHICTISRVKYLADIGRIRKTEFVNTTVL